MISIIDAPRSACGPNSSQNAESTVSSAIHHRPPPNISSPIASITRRSMTRASCPAIGADRNIAAPVTNIVSPICRLS